MSIFNQTSQDVQPRSAHSQSQCRQYQTPTDYFPVAVHRWLALFHNLLRISDHYPQNPPTPRRRAKTTAPTAPLCNFLLSRFVEPCRRTESLHPDIEENPYGRIDARCLSIGQRPDSPNRAYLAVTDNKSHCLRAQIIYTRRCTKHGVRHRSWPVPGLPSPSAASRAPGVRHHQSFGNG